MFRGTELPDMATYIEYMYIFSYASEIPLELNGTSCGVHLIPTGDLV